MTWFGRFSIIWLLLVIKTIIMQRRASKRLRGDEPDQVELPLPSPRKRQKVSKSREEPKIEEVKSSSQPVEEEKASALP
jgi:hypothetical protein